MKVYVAGASAERDLIASYMGRLRHAGIEVVHNWPAIIDRVGTAQDGTTSEEDRRRYASEDLQMALEANAFWLLIPQATPTIGAWVELGFVMAVWSPVRRKKRIVISGAYHRSIFTSLADKCYSTHDDALAFLIGGSRVEDR
jgi:hypothetical protein